MAKQSATQLVYHVNPQALVRVLREREQNGEASYAIRLGDMGQGMIHFGWGVVRVFFEAEMARWSPPQEHVTYKFCKGVPPVLAPGDRNVSSSWEKLERRAGRALLHVTNALVESPDGRQYRKCTNGTGGVIWLMKGIADLLAARADELRLELRFEVTGKQTIRVSKPQNPFAMQRGESTGYETIGYFSAGTDIKEDLGASTPLDATAYTFTCLLCGRCEQEQGDDTALRQAKMYAHLIADHALSQVDIQRATRCERLEWAMAEERAGVLHLPQPAFLHATRAERFDQLAPQEEQAPLEP